MWTLPTWELPFGDSLLSGLGGKSVLGGAQIGYDFQLSDWVFGLEGEIAQARIQASADRSDYFAVLGTKFDWVADITARADYAMGPALLYGKGGLAFAGVKNYYTFERLDPFSQTRARNSDNLIGGSVGVGWDYGSTQHISIKMGYDYFNFGKTAALRLTCTMVAK